ncbi:hypothetical protein BG006_003612 [Podila minutissima]|uniref:Uncharacterized protein n=1 Tax=Podila minutissima TaxID=64525 RepID=A0A9P5SPQ6_9FUNG|nr:hypothetical protein BG006_003612 [Podila minutissima]
MNAIKNLGLETGFVITMGPALYSNELTFDQAKGNLKEKRKLGLEQEPSLSKSLDAPESDEGEMETEISTDDEYNMKLVLILATEDKSLQVVMLC